MRRTQNDGSVQDEVVLTGSNAYEAYSITVGNSVQTVNFQNLVKNIMVTNDGAGDVLVAMRGNMPANGTDAVNDNLSSRWVFAGGGWTSGGVFNYGTDSSYSATTGATATYKPGINTNKLTWSLVKGSGVGIGGIQLSNDNGATWQSPSTISGVTRSDGATGTAMDTYDGYIPTGTAKVDVSFTLPNYAVWAMRITVTGTKNASATTAQVWVDAGKVAAGPYTIPVKAGESQTFPIVTSDISLVSADGTTQNVRVVAIQ